MEDKEISFSIERRLGALSEPGRTGWTKELNLVSWNGHDSKYDLREWSPDHDRMGRGITLSSQEAQSLCRLLQAAMR